MPNALSQLVRKLRKPTTGSSRARVVEVDDGQDFTGIQLPWWLAASLAAVLTILVGWLVWVGLSFLAWTVAPQIDPMSTVHVATQGWLLSHGVHVGLPGARLTLVPLGMTIVTLLVGTGLCGWFAGRVRDLPAELSPRRRTLQLSGVFAATYLVILLVVRQVSEGSGFGINFVLSLLIVAGIPLYAFSREQGWRIQDEVPVQWRWLLAARPAITAGIGVMLAFGMVALLWSLISGWDRVTAIHESLQPGIAGSVVLVILQLLYLPNLLLWAASWVSGAGLQLGLGSVISPAGTDVGMLPAIPIFGIVPESGPQPDAMVWWALSTIVAGCVAAARLLRQARRDVEAWPTYVIGERGNQRVFDPVRAAITGALIGILTGLILVGVTWLANGNLGNLRLVDLGARLGALAIMAPTGMGIGGLLTASLISWRASRGLTRPWTLSRTQHAPDSQAGESEPTSSAQPISDTPETPSEPPKTEPEDLDETRPVRKN